jgi:hypothetical protein
MKQKLHISKYIFVSIAILALIPGVIFAAGTAITNLVALIETILKALFPIMTALGILVFGYNVIKYLTSKTLSDQNFYKSGLLNSLFALFIFFTIIGLVSILARSIGIPALGEDLGLVGGQTAATGTGAISTFRGIALSISSFISNRIIPIMIAVALLAFLGNIVISMSKSDEEKERTVMNQYLRWGILGVFVLLTFFSIVSIFTGSLFGFKAVIPQFQTQNK